VYDGGLEVAVRRAVLDWLDQRTDFGRAVYLFPAHELRHGFAFEGRRVPLVGAQQGIWKPSFLGAALSIRTAYTPPGETPPYDDAIGDDGNFRYKYRGTDPHHAENRALRVAMEQALPLVWFWGVGQSPARYEAVRPVWLIDEEPTAHQFVVAVDEAQRSVTVGPTATEAERRYAQRLTRQRVHQPVFRARVIAAYGEQCAVCRLRYVSLLDAAHILRDGHPRGEPIVPNGLSLCKIHHAAFDQNLIGIRPDTLQVEVRADVRTQHDGPMLLHGIQEMQGSRLLVPSAHAARPDPTRLEERWDEFRQAG